MKTYTNRFRQNIKTIGRQFDFFVTYTKNNVNYILEGEKLISINPHYEANLLKSVMKEFEFESTEYIEKDTIINAKFGLQVDNSLTVKEVNEMKSQRLNQIPVNMLSSSLLGFEYINYGNYIIKDEPVYNADTQTYTYQCYDKMLYSMKDYESLGVTYPITVRDYIKALCNKLGLKFKNQNSTFANYNRQINNELYLDSEGNDLGYTYRDVLDELAQVTASIICINEETDELEIRYPKQTNDTIDEEFLKDVNVKFEEKYGPINTVVLSRSGKSDNVYYPENLPENPCEIKIVDNQIMNFNDRSDYLPDIYNKLNGIEYYINDFSSTGILWYELADIYNISVENKTYKCLMLNDDVNIEAGLEELIHTDMPEQSQTDYTKADKTDRKINQTYLIVDKQNQKIEGVISNVTDQNQKISRVTQTVDELNSKISDIADITISNETQTGSVELEKINESEPIYIKIHPIAESITCLHPFQELYPLPYLTIQLRELKFTNKTTGSISTYELPDDLLYYDSNNYDEFILDYDSQTCFINKKCKYNENGDVTLLDKETVKEFEFPHIRLTDGDYKIELLKYDNTVYNAYMLVRLMAQNIYTTQFATKAEVNSEINQTATDITLSVDKKLTNYSTTSEMNSAISIKANEITSTVSNNYETKNSAQKNYSTLTQTANRIQTQVTNNTNDISTINQTIDGVEIEVGKKYNTSDFTNAKITAKINDGTSNVQISADKIDLRGKTIDMTSDNIAIKSNNFNVDKSGNMECNNAKLKGNIEISNGKLQIDEYGISTDYLFIHGMTIFEEGTQIQGRSCALNGFGWIGASEGYIGDLRVTTLKYDSVKEKKKNFEKYKNALQTINNIDIYKYNYKNENDEDKKHIGFVIGDKYKYSKEVTSKNNDGVDLYSFISVCCKAIQEQQIQIEELKKEIEKLKEGK